MRLPFFRFCAPVLGLVAAASVRAALPAPDPERLVILQYTSGSTSEPKGVMLPDRVLTANIDACREAAELAPDDVMLSWLPLYHDMGLVGCCLTPVMTQITVDYLPSTAFARRPLLWLKLLSDLGGTISFGPTFGY